MLSSCLKEIICITTRVRVEKTPTKGEVIMLKKVLVGVLSLSLLTSGGAVFAQTTSPEIKLTSEQAKEVALKTIENAKVLVVELDVERLTAYYEVDLVKDNVLHEVKVDATTGEVKTTKTDKDQDDLKEKEEKAAKIKLTIEEAREAALKKVPNAQVRDITVEKSAGVVYYQVDLVDGTTQYEVELNAETGEFLAMEQEHLDGDDD